MVILGGNHANEYVNHELHLKGCLARVAGRVVHAESGIRKLFHQCLERSNGVTNELLPTVHV